MLAKEIMKTNLITVSPEASLFVAAHLMTKHNISGLPVVKDDHVLVGIISESDIIEDKTLFSGLDHWINIESFLKQSLIRSPESESDHDPGPERAFLSSPVREYMSTRLITATPTSSIEEVSRLLVRNKVNRIPILEGKKVVGIITRGDILKAVSKMT